MDFWQSGTDLGGEVKESESKEVDDRSFPRFTKQLATALVGLNPRKYLDWTALLHSFGLYGFSGQNDQAT
jgi:hypothetical protein